MDESTPEMLIVAGPNGAGKTTLAMSYARAFDAEYIGADKIASGGRSLSPKVGYQYDARKAELACAFQCLDLSFRLGGLRRYPLSVLCGCRALVTHVS